MNRITPALACYWWGVAASSFAEYIRARYIRRTAITAETCEECHPGTVMFLQTVHWKHASKVTMSTTLPAQGIRHENRIYTMCNGNDVVNNLKEIPKVLRLASQIFRPQHSPAPLTCGQHRS
jgi:hypothetical protein